MPDVRHVGLERGIRSTDHRAGAACYGAAISRHAVAYRPQASCGLWRYLNSEGVGGRNSFSKAENAASWGVGLCSDEWACMASSRFAYRGSGLLSGELVCAVGR